MVRPSIDRVADDPQVSELVRQATTGTLMSMAVRADALPSVHIELRIRLSMFREIHTALQECGEIGGSL